VYAIVRGRKYWRDLHPYLTNTILHDLLKNLTVSQLVLAGLYGSAVLENAASEPCPEAVESKLTPMNFFPSCKSVTHKAQSRLKVTMINKF
jgi:hypothetical protein